MKTCDTFLATISLGLKEGYDGKTHSLYAVESICQQYCDDVGLCVTVTPTKFVYKNGGEDGCFIGLINYPRFPADRSAIVGHAVSIAKQCMAAFKQQRVSIICSDGTITLEADE